MKPFDIELAKAGDPVIQRNGLPARIVDFNLKGNEPFTMVVIITLEDGYETIRYYKDSGRYYEQDCDLSQLDLFMAPKKVQYWANVYKNNTNNNFFMGPWYTTEEMCQSQIESFHQAYAVYIKTILIHEEEI